MPEYVDKKLACVDCGAAFDFTAGQQEFFAEKGFTNEPKRCGPCREAKKAKSGSGDRGSGSRGGGGGGGGGSKEMFVTKCAECGGEARLPFKPTGSRPVYCSNCFNQRR